MSIDQPTVFGIERSVYIEVDQYPWIAVPGKLTVYITAAFARWRAETGMKQETSFPSVRAIDWAHF